MLVDSHCHLDHFTADEDAVVARAVAAGVGAMLTIGPRLSRSAGIRALADRHREVWCTIGIHPHHAAEEGVPTLAALLEAADHPRVVGLGEAGLDYFYDHAPHDVQQDCFRLHIRAAQSAGLPLVIHARDADDDIAAILQAETQRGGAFPFILHCFSSSRRLAEIGVRLGGHISFSGILTFQKSQEIRDIARDVPADRLLVETDSPYLAPVPLRGKVNEPTHVVHIAAKLAEIRGLEPAALADLTTANFTRLFPRARLAG